ncbi:MAG: DUF3604 domain-containing protein [Chloroflexi bacterium]|nr:DUF3604 domain-containing protein [Chloroflexota bacterium]
MQDADTWLGTATIDPAGAVVAGSVGTWTIRYRTGRYGVDDTGSVKIAIRMTCDWESPQIDDATGPGYCTARTTGRARLEVRADPYGGVRPWSRVIWLLVRDGTLVEGDEITVVLGDRSQGSPGMRAQTYVDEGFEFRVLVDCFGTGVFERLPSSPRFPILAASTDRLIITAPSDLVAGEATWLHVRAIDAFGNPVAGYRGTLRFGGAGGLPERYTFSETDRGAHRFDGLRLTAPGLHHVVVRDDQGRAAESNPIRCHAAAPDRRLFWGDTQGQSGATVGTGGVGSFYRYARDIAAIDFVVHSGNDFQITREHWAETRALTQDFHAPGRFVPYLSYEWSGNYGGGGDHNVVYLGDDGPLHRSSHWQIADKSDADTDRYPITELWRTLRGRDDVIAFPHVGGRRSNFDHFDAAFCPVIEIASVHGRFEWFAREALERGLVVGFVGATDDHSGRPGASWPTARPFLPKRGSITAVLAHELTREGLWEALRARRCYATSGERMLLDVQADGRPMGAHFRADAAPELRVAVVGTAPIERIVVLRGAREIHDHRLGRPGRRIRVAWTGLRNDMRARYLPWHGGLTLSAGQIVKAEPYAFDIALDGISEVGERHVRWRSGTSGDPDGVVLTLDAPDDAEIAFAAGPANLSFRPSVVGDAPLVFNLPGGIDQRVVVERVPDELAARAATLAYRDPAPQRGMNAYWLRVVQVDGEMAWSSPIYVEFA